MAGSGFRRRKIVGHAPKQDPGGSGALYSEQFDRVGHSALKTAHSGDTIQLASGTYAPVVIDSAKFDGAGVTITSQNPAGGAILTGVYIRGSEGLNIKNVEMVVDPAKPDFPFYVFGSSRISFDHLNAHGSLDGNAQNDMAALMIRSSNGVTVTNSDFHELKFGIQHLDSTNVTVTGNTFHEIRTDGIRGGARRT
jgi:hypothetical protein